MRGDCANRLPFAGMPTCSAVLGKGGWGIRVNPARGGDAMASASFETGVRNRNKARPRRGIPHGARASGRVLGLDFLQRGRGAQRRAGQQACQAGHAAASGAPQPSRDGQRCFPHGCTLSQPQASAGALRADAHRR